MTLSLNVNLKDLSISSDVETSSDVIRKRPSLDSKGRMYATGKRKTSIARVWIKPGQGDIVVNGRSFQEYFPLETLRTAVIKPFKSADCEKKFSVWCTIKGGGLSGQAGALCHGIAKALQWFDENFRGPLKKDGLITRDSRRVERKKPGHHKARKKPQFCKR